MNNKIKIIAISFLISCTILSSCNGQQKCGVGKLHHSKVEFYICEEMLNIDTIKNNDKRWFAESELANLVSDSWLGEFDTIAFH